MLSDDQLLVRLKTLCRISRRVDARVVELLIEVENRRLDLRMASASLWDFCRRTLGMSEGTTQRRIEAVRAVQKIPRLLGHIASGAVTLGALALVRAHLNEDNAEELIAEIAGKTRTQIEELLVIRAPRPDVPARLRLLPTPAAAPVAPLVGEPSLVGVASAPELASPSDSLAASRCAGAASRRTSLGAAARRASSLGPQATALLAALQAAASPSVPRPAASPSAPHLPTKSGAISRVARRAVFARDGERCTYVDARGERCASRTWLELDHIDARGRGGAGVVENLRVRCRAHDHLHAEVDFGRLHIARKIRERRAKSAEPPS